MTFFSRPNPELNGRQRTIPEGWPVGSFSTYAQAQAAVDMLSDKEFDVSAVSIVGVDLMECENVLGRLTWPKVLLSGLASGGWVGLFMGTLLGVVTGDWSSSLIFGVLLGSVFYTSAAAIQYAASRGKRDFASTTQIVASRYDILCDPATAPQARDLISEFTHKRPN
ncbi:hypothetical protein N7326_05205 [Corynebacterium sp. ES2794-CONJ1]|uniref:general stress protein n=1 Tax=unclassified Corynebacterium TaxID=2624378 RepID=UPI002169AF10|nr:MULTISPECIES: general stress protein [unclassified Corynebacterium]MCS4491770.1 hypothetical protein [Corynebacterium sp. ES2715-CONJ3]MCS4531875.1 hypothetical protein [Corynebacterium sp. ES2730-CONJ]MCU9519272.1 hypothetical protein [Corynebacterium sp. ES2794-CONJ1]